jgi:hypothetical protein
MHRSLNHFATQIMAQVDAYHPGVRGSFSERTHRRSARFGGLPAMPMHAGRAFVLESIQGEARPANKVRRHHHHRAVCHGAQHSRALFVQ